MIKEQLKKAEQILSLLQQCESSAQELYRQCALCFPGEKEFWTSLDKEEGLHYAYIERMKNLLAENPSDYQKKRDFNPIALKTVIRGIVESTEDVKTGKKNLLKIVNIVYDIETSLFESKFHDFLESTNDEYNKLLQNIMTDTFRHRRRVEVKRDEIKSRQKS